MGVALGGDVARIAYDHRDAAAFEATRHVEQQSFGFTTMMNGNSGARPSVSCRTA